MLYKAIALILSTILLATVQMSAASAGCGGGHGGFRAYQSTAYKKQALQQSRARKASQVAAVRQKKAVQQAKIEKSEPAKVADADKKEATKVAGKDGPENELNVASVDQSCTRFNAQIGTTVTVECAKQ